MYTFRAGDVTVGRDRDCDICLYGGPARQLISRRHAILRFDGTQWEVVDTSQHGVFVGGARVGPFTIRDRQSITLGGPQGPRLIFRVGTFTGRSTPHNPPWLERIPTSTCTRSWETASATRFALPGPRRGEPELERVGETMRLLPPSPPFVGGTVGRAMTNDLVVDDALVSRMHALLLPNPAGLEIRDVNSRNGTFVNSVPITRALLRDGDNVTVGNTDFVVSGTTLVAHPRPPAGAAPSRCR
jgi:pSer/pThr/pTyr-binding forkhead associated (FHA) protein